MSNKARRRPSWKKTYDKSAFTIVLLNEEDDSVWETVRVPYMGYWGKKLIAEHGVAGAEKYIRQILIDAANETLAMKEYYNDQALQSHS